MKLIGKAGGGKCSAGVTDEHERIYCHLACSGWLQTARAETGHSVGYRDKQLMAKQGVIMRFSEVNARYPMTSHRVLSQRVGTECDASTQTRLQRPRDRGHSPI